MSVAALAQTRYGHSARTLKAPRDIAYEVLARVTGRIQAQLPHPRGRTGAALTQALDDNRRLWAAFAVDLAHPDNGFPADLRARLLYLAEFTLCHTTRVLAEINTAVMRGLRGQGPRP